MSKLIYLIFIIVIAYNHIIYACTAFIYEQKVVQAFDWSSDTVRVVYTPPNITRTALSFAKESSSWQTAFASFTFVQFHIDLPQSGMNEKGLVVVGLAQDNAQYPMVRHESNVVNELQFIQYVLDNFSSVGEVVQAIGKDVQIAPAFVDMHYLLYDANNNTAVVEGINGSLHVIPQENFSPMVLTNTPYEDALAYFKKAEGLDAIPNISVDKVRFSEAIRALQDERNGINDIFSRIQTPARPILSEILQGAQFHTRWKIIFDPLNKLITFAFVNQKREATYRFTIDRPSKDRVVISNPEDESAQFRPITWWDDHLSQFNAVLAATIGRSSPQTALIAGTTTLSLCALKQYFRR